MRKRPRWPYYLLGSLFGCPCLLLAIGLMAFKHSFSKVADTLPDELAAAEKAGMYTSVDRLRTDLHAAPVDNGADDYRSAFKLLKLVPLPKGWDTILADFNKRKATPIEENEVRRVIVSADQAIRALARASLKPKVDWDRPWQDGVNVLFPEFASMKTGVKLLCAKAVLEAKDGHTASAIQLLKTAFKVSGDAGKDPILISSLVQCSAETISMTALSNLLQARHDLATLEKVRILLKDLPSPPRFQWALSGELVITREAIQDAQKLASQTESTDSPMFRSFPDSLLIRDATYRKAWEAKAVHYERLAFIAAGKPTWKEVRDEMGKVDSAVEADKSIENHFNQDLLPIFTQAGDAFARLIANRRVMICSVELLRQRELAGKCAKSLPEMGDSSIDPFTLKPLRYIVQGKGFKVYSLGSDLKDDGGMDAGEARKKSISTYDLVRSFK